MSDSKDDTEILRAVIGGHQVSMTHRKAGTMLVSKTAYRHFRRILIAREIADSSTNQSEIIAELGVSIDEATWLSKRDSHGNMMLLERGLGVMFIVDAERRVLCCTYDHREHARAKKGRKSADGKPSDLKRAA